MGSSLPFFGIYLCYYSYQILNILTPYLYNGFYQAIDTTSQMVFELTKITVSIMLSLCICSYIQDIFMIISFTKYLRNNKKNIDKKNDNVENIDNNNENVENNNENIENVENNNENVENNNENIENNDNNEKETESGENDWEEIDGKEIDKTD
jgi:hypothetical protein